MKKLAFSTTFFVFAFVMVAQSPFRVKVIDAQTSENIENAIVFIEEIPLPDQETDKYGVVSFQNVPEDRKVRVNVRKKGFLPNQLEVVANRAIKVDNNVIIKLQKEPTTPQVIIYGEVSDSKGNEIENATVEISILGKPYSTETDKSGNYQIRIDGSVISSTQTYQFEVKKQGCTKMKSTENTPKSELVNKDVVLTCNGLSNDNSSTTQTKPKDTLKEDNPLPAPLPDNCLKSYHIEFVSCIGSTNGQSLEIEVKFKHDLPNQKLLISTSQSKAFSESGATLEIFQSCIASDCGTRSTWANEIVPTDQFVLAKIKIRNILPSIKSIKTFTLHVKSHNAEGRGSLQECDIKFRDIPIKWN